MRLRFSITVSLIALFAVLAALAQWTALLVSHQALQATVRAREIDKMLTVGRVVEELVVEQARRARLTARLTARRNSLGRSLAQSGEAAVETVREVLDEALAASAVAQMEIADSRQLVVYRAHERARNGDLSEVWGVFEALAGQGQMASAIDNGVVTVQAIEPVDWKGKVVGALVAGVRIDSSLLAKIGEDLGADLFLIARTGALLASSQSVPYTLDQAAIQEAFTQKIPVYRHEMQAHRTLAYLPLTIVDNAFVIVAVLDSAQAYEMLARANERSLLITLGILLVSVLLGSALVRWVLRPLRALRERAEASAVALTGSAIESGSSNEIAAIVKVLETLTDRLVRRNRELAEATQAAEHASKAKSQFLSNMSHEIRTPLNGILGMAEVLARTPLAAEQARYLRAITSAGQSLHALLGDILDLAKIEAGRIVVEQIDFDLMTVLVPMADAFREIASVHGNVLSSDLRIPASLEVNGDPTRLRQVLSNLLSNAIKFTEHGRVLLAAERLADRDGDTRLWLRFVVRDSGIGIAPEALARLFQPFVQADQSTTRRYGGSGLGLVICRHLVELMGGSISVESTPGAGSTFTVDLPFAAALAPVASSGSGAGSRQTLNGRVLVAEDNPVNQSVIEAMLGELGVTVTIVANGAAAVEALPGGAFDLVLMDCQMPVMDGYAATAAIRASAGALARVPIIALTANALPEDRQRCLAAGMDDYLSKPIRLEALATCLRRWLPDDDSRAAALPASALLPAAPVLPEVAPVPVGAPLREGMAPLEAAAPEPPATRSGALLDRSALIENPDFAASLNGDLIARVIGIYLQETPELLATISSRLAADAWPEVTRAAHSLKSSSAAIGLPSVAALAARLEGLARRAERAAVEAELPRLQAEFARALPELDAELARLSHPAAAADPAPGDPSAE